MAQTAEAAWIAAATLETGVALAAGVASLAAAAVTVVAAVAAVSGLAFVQHAASELGCLHVLAPVAPLPVLVLVLVLPLPARHALRSSSGGSGIV